MQVSSTGPEEILVGDNIPASKNIFKQYHVETTLSSYVLAFLAVAGFSVYNASLKAPGLFPSYPNRTDYPNSTSWRIAHEKSRAAHKVKWDVYNAKMFKSFRITFVVLMVIFGVYKLLTSTSIFDKKLKKTVPYKEFNQTLEKVQTKQVGKQAKAAVVTYKSSITAGIRKGKLSSIEEVIAYLKREKAALRSKTGEREIQIAESSLQDMINALNSLVLVN
ncbi:MAG: hypothetical protein SP4CHLAM5_05590 [Chlamydiia bacterium]|nr:hypothetical protein [Chlamydiia bacterium]MCH9618429.1 hypothetical protein [Chlamydiia bacterium]MCH9623755.1 hypothetical protein [Chlamydiia bacterium]